MSRDDLYDILITAAAFVLFFEIGIYVGRNIEKMIILSYLSTYNKKEKSSESVPLSTE